MCRVKNQSKNNILFNDIIKNITAFGARLVTLLLLSMMNTVFILKT